MKGIRSGPRRLTASREESDGELDGAFSPTRRTGELDGVLSPTRPFGELDCSFGSVIRFSRVSCFGTFVESVWKKVSYGSEIFRLISR